MPSTETLGVDARPAFFANIDGQLEHALLVHRHRRERHRDPRPTSAARVLEEVSDVNWQLVVFEAQEDETRMFHDELRGIAIAARPLRLASIAKLLTHHVLRDWHYEGHLLLGELRELRAAHVDVPGARREAPGDAEVVEAAAGHDALHQLLQHGVVGRAVEDAAQGAQELVNGASCSRSPFDVPLRLQDEANDGNPQGLG
mmetsp:Transcript_130121/g.324402  ORF Transcript_130121/g.324402 Transcript_130121/m.324402 type:complete len:201 (-) Transcript_130121:456-1058(-)